MKIICVEKTELFNKIDQLQTILRSNSPDKKSTDALYSLNQLKIAAQDPDLLEPTSFLKTLGEKAIGECNPKTFSSLVKENEFHTKKWFRMTKEKLYKK